MKSPYSSVPAWPLAPETEASPARRAWVAVALMEALFALLFIPSLFLFGLLPRETVPEDRSDDLLDMLFAALGALAVLALFLMFAFIVYAIAALVLIPLGAHTLGRLLDGRTREWKSPSAAMLFAGVAAIPGSVIAVPLALTETWGAVSLVNLVLVPALAAFGTRMLLPIALRVQAVRVIAAVVGAVAAAMPFAVIVWYLAET